jgi:hypothetical protein
MDHRDTTDPLGSLPRRVDPPDELEMRVKRTLYERRLLRQQRARVWYPAAAVAAALALIGLGYILDQAPDRGRAAADGLSRFALFLYEDASFDTSRPEAELVREYSAWATDLRERGRLDMGVQLGGTERLLIPAADSVTIAARGIDTDAGTLTGMFIIRAATETDALDIAGTCPHLKYGGRVAVRAIVGP